MGKKVNWEAIANVIRADPARGDYEIARECGCSSATVGKVRRVLGLRTDVRTVKIGDRVFFRRRRKLKPIDPEALKRLRPRETKHRMSDVVCECAKRGWIISRDIDGDEPNWKISGGNWTYRHEFSWLVPRNLVVKDVLCRTIPMLDLLHGTAKG